MTKFKTGNSSAGTEETRTLHAEKKQVIQDLFKAHYAQMYRLARTILYDEDESKDAVSEVREKKTKAVDTSRMGY